MKSKKSRIFMEIIIIVLSIALTGSCLLYAGRNIASSSSRSDSVLELDSMQKQHISKSKIVKALGDFDCEEVLSYRTGRNSISRESLRLFRFIFSNLIPRSFSNPLIRGFLSNSNYDCFSNTVIINYIHDIDGKIKD